jgi:hypothetical protein
MHYAAKTQELFIVHARGIGLHNYHSFKRLIIIFRNTLMKVFKYQFQKFLNR